MIFGDDGDETATFDEADEFVPAHVPAPGTYLDGHAVLADGAHVAVHAASRDRFERFGVYDATFGYNLAKLNRDHRHPDAGFRYGIDPDEPGVLRVEFTPTTAFCPQSTTLTRGVFRAWNATDSAFRLVSVRVDPMHQRSQATNDRLRELEAHYEETGEVVADEGESDAGAVSGFDPEGVGGGEGDLGTEDDPDDADAETGTGGLSAPW